MYLVYIIHELEKVCVQSKSDFDDEPEFNKQLAIQEYQSEYEEDCLEYAEELVDNLPEYKLERLN